MKALTIDPDFALNIWFEEKTIEVRTWTADYRGDILICAGAQKLHGTIPGHALCVANLRNIRPFMRHDCEAALIAPADFQNGLYAWELDNIRTIKPVPVRGMPGFFTVDDSKIECIEDPDPDDNTRWMEIWERLFV